MLSGTFVGILGMRFEVWSELLAGVKFEETFERAFEEFFGVQSEMQSKLDSEVLSQVLSPCLCREFWDYSYHTLG